MPRRGEGNRAEASASVRRGVGPHGECQESGPEPMPLAAGTRLGPYEIVGPLGAGGMGEVYKAPDTRLNRTVAIKVLPPHCPRNPEMKQRFDREAQTIAGAEPSAHLHAVRRRPRRTGPTSW